MTSQKSKNEEVRNTEYLEALKKTVDMSFARIMFEPSGNIKDANDNFVNALGYGSLKEIVGKHHEIFVDPEYKNSSEYKDFWNDLRKGITQEGQFKRITKAGEDIWIQAAYTPIVDQNGKVTDIIKIAMDITEEVNTKINMQGLTNTVDSSFARIMFEPSGNIKDANDNFVNALGYGSLKEIVGKHHEIFVDHEYKNSSEYKDFWNDLRKGITKEGQFKRVTKAGEDIWIQAAYTPVKDDSGTVINIIKIASDITAQKNAEIERDAIITETNRVLKAMANGDMSESFELEATGDLKDIGDNLNIAIGNMNDLLRNITDLSNLIAASSEEMLSKAEEMKGSTQEVATAIVQMSEGVQDQVKQTDESSKLIESVLDNSKEMGEKANIINQAAESGSASAKEGVASIEKVVESMKEIETTAETTNNSIVVLTKRSEEIARTLNVITDIAGQTNLLALNAAIEAARAGDAGRGFAVVAEEIRKLAEDSRNSASDIDKVISEVQKDIAEASKSMDGMKSSVKNGNTASKNAEEVFKTIEDSSSSTLVLSQEVRESTRQQEASINETAKNIEKIVVVSEETAAGTEEISTSAKQLSQGMDEVSATSKDLADVAYQLQTDAAKFKLKDKNSIQEEQVTLKAVSNE